MYLLWKSQNGHIFYKWSRRLLAGGIANKITDEENGIIVVNLSRLNLLDRIQHAIKFIDFPEMLLHSQEDNITQLDKDVILSDAFIMAILRMSQTFVMVTDQPHHMVKREPVNY